MEWKNRLSAFFTTKRIIFLIAFMLLGLAAMRLNFSPLLGADNQFFTLFQFFGPVAGAFLGPVAGIIAVLGTQLADFILVSKEFTAVNLMRLLPMLFAAYYFGVHKRSLGRTFTTAVPLLCMAVFIMHPVGRTVWFFPLYWLIPVVISLLPKQAGNKTFLAALGATFTAHAIGGSLWIWTVPMTAAAWISLIPIVAYERLLFAVGITVVYIGMRPLVDAIVDRFRLGTDITLQLSSPEKGYAVRAASAGKYARK